MKIFFNSSMPRSGSTLLQNILGNRPDVYSTPTSPVFEFISSVKRVYSKSPMVKAQSEDEMKNSFLRFCLYGLHGFFDALTDKPYVMEKSRGWAVNYGFLESFYENPKIICMVRDLRDIVASMEKNYRLHPDKITLPENADSLHLRIAQWLEQDGKPVGISLGNLKEAFVRGYDKKIKFVRFEDLTRNPEKIMSEIHEYLEIPDFKYDFKNIIQVTHENDKFHGIYGDHKINSNIQPLVSKAKERLGQELCDIIYRRHTWYFDVFGYNR